MVVHHIGLAEAGPLFFLYSPLDTSTLVQSYLYILWFCKFNTHLNNQMSCVVSHYKGIYSYR